MKSVSRYLFIGKLLKKCLIALKNNARISKVIKHRREMDNNFAVV